MSSNQRLEFARCARRTSSPLRGSPAAQPYRYAAKSAGLTDA